MDSSEKLVRKFLTDKTHITVEDCDRLLVAYGYSLHKKGGSHRSYHKKGCKTITIPEPKKSRYVLSPYIRQIVRDLGLEE